MKLSEKNIDKIHKTLKESGHWYIVSAQMWEHPANKVPNCFAILFDGSIQVKFEVLPRQKLRFALIPNKYEYLHLSKMGVKEGDIITVNQLAKKIYEYPWVLRNGMIAGRTTKKFSEIKF